MRFLAFAVLALALTSACDSDSPTAPDDRSISFETLVKSSQSGYGESIRETLRTPDQWNAAWNTLHQGRQPVPPRPFVDFDRSFVVVVAAGTRPNGCFAIEIAGVGPSIEGQPVFDVVESTPGPDCVCTEAITRPAHAVRVDRFSGDAEYLERVEQLAC